MASTQPHCSLSRPGLRNPFTLVTACQDPKKTTKLYFVLSSNSDPESKTLIIVSWHYLSLYTWPVPLSINTRPTLSSLSLWISDHYTSANIKLLKRVVSLLGTGFYILLLIMVITMFHIFLVFKSHSCNVLASFDINFVSSLHILFSKFPSLISIPIVLLLFWNWDNWRAGQHSTHAEAKVLFWLSISDFGLANIRISRSLV